MSLEEVIGFDPYDCRQAVLRNDRELSDTALNLQSHQEERVTDPDTGGQKGQKLERTDLLPVEPLLEVARVYGMGAKKYDDHNWRKGYRWSLSYGALLRHVLLFWKKENRDPESGLHHLAHAVFHCFALMEFERIHPNGDDRP